MKECIKCKKQYSLSEFHKHSGMKDGHLNKCKYCVVKDVAAWREKNPNARAIEYERGRPKHGRMPLGEYRKKLSENAIGAKASKNKYMAKRRLRTKRPLLEIDSFAFEEADSLARLRNKMTNIEWSVDHIIPLNHKDVSGLHVHNNFQVVPRLWNETKNRHNCDEFRYEISGY